MASCVPLCRAALSRESTLRCGEGHIEGMRGIRLKEVFAVALRGEQLCVLNESPESSSVDRKTTRRECDALECAAPLLCANARHQLVLIKIRTQYTSCPLRSSICTGYRPDGHSRPMARLALCRTAFSRASASSGSGED